MRTIHMKSLILGRSTLWGRSHAPRTTNAFRSPLLRTRATGASRCDGLTFVACMHRGDGDCGLRDRPRSIYCLGTRVSSDSFGFVFFCRLRSINLNTSLKRRKYRPALRLARALQEMLYRRHQPTHRQVARTIHLVQ